MPEQFYLIIRSDGQGNLKYLSKDYTTWTTDRDEACVCIRGAALNQLWEEFRGRGVEIIETE